MHIAIIAYLYTARMAVYTVLDVSDCEELLAHYDLGHYLRHVGIGAGIENTNYFLDTEGAHHGRFVLTVFERLTAAQLPYYLELAAHLAQAGLPVPAPQRVVRGAAAGQLVTLLKGKPAALVARVPGEDVIWPTADHCAQIGSVSARMHLAGKSFTRAQPNLRGLAWMLAQQQPLSPHLPKDVLALLADELAQQAAFDAQQAHNPLPAGAVHADLFRDNALFEAGRLSGVIDFYFAGDDAWLYDFCVTLNDWCIDHETGQLDVPLARAFTLAYEAVRPFTEAERTALPMMARRAALRFWISRLADWFMPRDAAVLTPKDPSHFQRILTARRQTPVGYSSLL
jgi:homoserine kinase type II